MALLDQFRIEALPKTWADEGKLWQETYFPEMPTVFDSTRIDPTAPHGVRATGSRLPHGVRQGNRRGHASDGSDRPPARRDLVFQETGVRRGATASHADGRRPDVG